MSIRFSFRCKSVCHLAPIVVHCSSLTIIFREPEWAFFWNTFKCTFEKLQVGKAKYPPTQTNSNPRSIPGGRWSVNFACGQSGNSKEPSLPSLLQPYLSYGCPDSVIYVPELQGFMSGSSLVISTAVNYFIFIISQIILHTHRLQDNSCYKGWRS